MSRANVELVLRGYRAFVNGDLGAVAELLDSDVEWHGVDGESRLADADEVRHMLAERSDEQYRIALERCIGKGDDVLVAFRASGLVKDALDDRPLQTRRYFTVGRYFGIVTVREGQILRVQDYPNLRAALDVLGVDEETP